MSRTSILFCSLYCCVPATYGALKDDNYLSMWRVRSIAQAPTRELTRNTYSDIHKDVKCISSLSVLHTCIGNPPTNKLRMLENYAQYDVTNCTDNPNNVDNTIRPPNDTIRLQVLRNQLAIDAREIFNTLPVKKRKYTTIVCVALKDQENQIKRFAFHNGTEWDANASSTSRSKKYHVIQVERAHVDTQ